MEYVDGRVAAPDTDITVYVTFSDPVQQWALNRVCGGVLVAVTENGIPAMQLRGKTFREVFDVMFEKYNCTCEISSTIRAATQSITRLHHTQHSPSLAEILLLVNRSFDAFKAVCTLTSTLF